MTGRVALCAAWDEILRSAWGSQLGTLLSDDSGHSNPQGIRAAPFSRLINEGTRPFKTSCVNGNISRTWKRGSPGEPVAPHIPIIPFVLIRLAPLSTTACGLWVAAGCPVQEVSGGGHRCPTWSRHVLDKAIVVGADRRSRHGRAF